MDIPEITNLATAIEAKREVLRLAIEKNRTEEDIWLELDIYRKTHSEGKKEPEQVKSLVKKTLTKSKIHITKSPLEDTLKQALEKRNIHFVTQQKIGRYRVDFFFPQGRLVVEADGKEYHSSEEQRLKDFERQCEIMRRGYALLRFRGTEIYKDVEGCVGQVSLFLNLYNTK